MKKLNKVDKKGDIAPKTIVEIVLLALGFMMVLYVYSQFAGEGMTDRAVCSQSVVYRGTLFDKYGFTTKEIVPLKCKTRLICISDKTKGDCGEELVGKYDTIKIDAREDKIDNQIKMTLAREMADCWSMLGEGKVQLFSRNYFTRSSKGVICSQIAFDKSIKEKKGVIHGFSQYLISHQVPGREESYWNYLTGGDSSNNVFLAKGSNFSEVDNLNLNKKSILFVELDQSYVGGILGVSTLGITGTVGGVLVGAKVGAVVGSFVPFPPLVGPGVGFIVGAGIAATATYFGGAAGGELQDQVQTQFRGGDFISGQFLIDYSPEAIKGFNVDSLENTI